MYDAQRPDAGGTSAAPSHESGVSVRVLVSALSQTIGGVETVIMNYYRRLQGEGLQFDFWCPFPGKAAFEDDVCARGSRVYHAHPRGTQPLRYYTDLRRFGRGPLRSYDVVWVNDCALNNVSLLAEAKKIGLPRRIVHAHNSENMTGGLRGTLRGSLHAIHKRRISSLATDYWACSPEAAKFFYPIRVLASPRFLLIRNAIDVRALAFDPDARQRLRQRLGIPAGDVVVGHVGRFHDQKNHRFLVEVFAEFHRLHPASWLILVGDGELAPQVREQVRVAGLADRVKFLGVRKDVPQLLSAMDLFVMPSRYEGLPMALLEAQAAGLPCLVSDAVSRDSKVCQGVDFLPLSVGAKVWAGHLVEQGWRRKPDPAAEFVWAGFDIDHEAKNLGASLRRFAQRA